MTSTDRQHAMIKIFLKANLQVHQLLEEFHPRYGFIAVPLEQANKIYEGALRMTQLHCQLQEYYETSGRKIFNITTKTHFCLHSLWLARHIHPSIVWCYKGEATMQRLQKLWKSCLDGKKHWQVGKVAAHKERYLLHVKAKL